MYQRDWILWKELRWKLSTNSHYNIFVNIWIFKYTHEHSLTCSFLANCFHWIMTQGLTTNQITCEIRKKNIVCMLQDIRLDLYKQCIKVVQIIPVRQISVCLYLRQAVAQFSSITWYPSGTCPSIVAVHHICCWCHDNSGKTWIMFTFMLMTSSCTYPVAMTTLLHVLAQSRPTLKTSPPGWPQMVILQKPISYAVQQLNHCLT